MLEALTLILLCQLVGEVTVLATGLPVPGPVLGLLLLLAWLFFRGGVAESVGRTADGLLAHLGAFRLAPRRALRSCASLHPSLCDPFD